VPRVTGEAEEEHPMRYTEFRTAIHEELKQSPDGRTWAQLRDSLGLPYKTPCYNWIARMEEEIGLFRMHGPKGTVWKLR
jgi:hypothetical protein